MQQSLSFWQLALAAALIAANAHSLNAKPQQVTAVVSQGIAQNQVIAMFGPHGL